ncbi:hypothetical protein EW146_g5737 [Bondarzewia mesenterica]|uniref:alpha-1,2-Mannosidase n=1 Tax=Bondarzewia mesenterica TaxID=1095465 RepID=A0A4S4LWA1_9AGAM|nr:hypothetical protein EW146_g5737 [Bondarzewia mesenterica]
MQDIFTDSYNAYREFAFGHDEVTPLSQGFSDPRNGWGATIVDGMSTMHIMGLNDLFAEALNFTQTINFRQSNTADAVNLFESTIRYIGGLLSAYELSGKEHQVLIEKAKELADKLSFAWSPDLVVPFGNVNFADNTPIKQSTSIGGGTLTLEWSRLTLDAANIDAILHQILLNLIVSIPAITHTADWQKTRLAISSIILLPFQARHLYSVLICALSSILGLPAQGVDPTSGNPIGGHVTWGGGSDSYFEYLIKYARLTNTDDDIFANAWRTAVDSSITTLARMSTVGNHLYLADFDNNRQIRHVGSHLECFHAGNWLLGGKLTNNDTIVDIGFTGIGPDAFAYISSDGNFTGGSMPSVSQLSFYADHGYYITSADYIQRPEVLESNFYAWRVTGNTTFLDRAASAVESFQKFLKTSTGYAGINNVNNEATTKIDDTESFWFAEVLKYLYLTFDDPDHISLDDYVFNTEAHPFIAPPAKSTYGSGFLR